MQGVRSHCFGQLSAPDPWYVRTCTRYGCQGGAVTLAAPQTRAELDEDLRVLGTTGPLGDEEYAALAEHGERVRRNAGGSR